MSSSIPGVESASVVSTLPLIEVAAAIELDPTGWTDAMGGSDALVSDDVKSVSITGTERPPCAKRRCRRKRHEPLMRRRMPQTGQQLLTAESLMRRRMPQTGQQLLQSLLWTERHHFLWRWQIWTLRSWSLPSLIAEQTEGLELKHICTMMVASTNRPSTEETLPQIATVKWYVQQWECLTMRSGLSHRRRESASVVSTAPLLETATDPNGGINTVVKKNALTSDDVVSIQDPEQSNVGHVAMVQSVKIGTNR